MFVTSSLIEHEEVVVRHHSVVNLILHRTLDEKISVEECRHVKTLMSIFR